MEAYLFLSTFLIFRLKSCRQCNHFPIMLLQRAFLRHFSPILLMRRLMHYVHKRTVNNLMMNASCLFIHLTTTHTFLNYGMDLPAHLKILLCKRCRFSLKKASRPTVLVARVQGARMAQEAASVLVVLGFQLAAPVAV
ncbi:Uncharacterised protein [Chlamydia trachomatis]|nr:Uncharacterised protein [Chlamydia trachomatis]